MIGLETKRPRSDLTRPVRSELALIELAGSVSPVPDGQGVSVVGQDRPSGPDLVALVAFEARSAHAVAVSEVPDPAFCAGSVALQPSLGSAAARLLAAGDEHPPRVQVVVFERLAGRADVESTFRNQSETRSLADNSDHCRGQNELQISPTYSDRK